MDPIVVTIVPASETDERRIFYFVYVYNNLLFPIPTATPYGDAARELLILGYDPHRLLFMRRAGVEVNQLAYPLARAAVLGPENQANPPFFWPLQQDGPGAVP
jgi:hypothetical protein